jgi:quercetin dioxygenase-like cupin family protein
MKNLIKILIVFVCFIFANNSVKSQELNKVDPAHCAILNDTLNVKLMKITLHPGEKLPVHSHPVYMFYCLTGGKITFTSEGKTITKTYKAGDHYINGPVNAHSHENVGKTDISILLIEIGAKK